MEKTTTIFNKNIGNCIPNISTLRGVSATNYGSIISTSNQKCHRSFWKLSKREKETRKKWICDIGISWYLDIPQHHEFSVVLKPISMRTKTSVWPSQVTIPWTFFRNFVRCLIDTFPRRNISEAPAARGQRGWIKSHISWWIKFRMKLVAANFP